MYFLNSESKRLTQSPAPIDCVFSTGDKIDKLRYLFLLIINLLYSLILYIHHVEPFSWKPHDYDWYPFFCCCCSSGVSATRDVGMLYLVSQALTTFIASRLPRRLLILRINYPGVPNHFFPRASGHPLLPLSSDLFSLFIFPLTSTFSLVASLFSYGFLSILSRIPITGICSTVLFLSTRLSPKAAYFYELIGQLDWRVILCTNDRLSTVHCPYW